MRKFNLCISVLALLFSTELFAQFKSGEFLLGTNISASQDNDQQFFNSQEILESYTKRFSTGLSLYYFLKEDVSISFGLGSSFNEQSGYQFVQSTLEYRELVNKERITRFNIGAHKYSTISERFSFRNGMNFSFGIGKNDPAIPSSFRPSSKIYELGVRSSHGLFYQLSESFIISTSIGSLYYIYEIEDAEGFDSNLIDTSYGINFSLSTLTFGFSYKF